MSLRPVILLLTGVSGALHAQSASVHNDSIYALRVDPAAYRGHDYVLLLDDGTVRLEADGRYTITLRQVVQVLTPAGVSAVAERGFGYSPQRQRAHLDWLRVLDADGTVVREGPAHQQEVPAAVDRDAPVYSDRRVIQMTLGGVAPGTLVDHSYTLETFRPWLPGDFLFTWTQNGGVPIRRSRLTLDTPARLPVRVAERNLRSPATDTVVGDRRVRTWTAAELPAVEGEYFAATPNDVIMAIAITGGLSWRAIAAWYDSVLTDRFELTPEIRAAHARQLEGARTLDDSLRATHRWVAQDFRYVSLALGEGGYVPRMPRDVFQTKFGDCKDKAMLFVSLVRQMGVNAYPVLVGAQGVVDSLRPSLKQFDHMIAAAERGGRIQYVDVVADDTPYGELPSGLQDRAGLALDAHGGTVVVLPAAPPDSNRFERNVVGTLRTDGSFIGKVTLSAAGTEQYSLREELAALHERGFDAHDELLRDYATSVYSSANVDSAQYTDGRDLTRPPRLTVWFTASEVIGQLGDRYYFNLPVSSFSNSEVVASVDAARERLFPIDIAEVNSPSVYRSAVEFRLPEGWKTELPDNVSVTGTFGYYRAEYRQAGRTLRVSREMGGRRGHVPPDSAPALRAWLHAVADDRTDMIVLSGDVRPTLAATKIAGAGAKVGDQTGSRLSGILIGLDDLSPGMKVTAERIGIDSGGPVGLILAFGSTEALESYERTLAAERMVSTVGDSRLIALIVAGAAFRTRAEANRPLEALDLLDLPKLWRKFVDEVPDAQMTLEGSRSVSLDGVGDRASGWILEAATPVAKLDIAFLLAAHGRLSTVVMVVGPRGELLDRDLAGLLRIMDERARRQDGYLTDREPDGTARLDAGAADSALAEHADVALNTIPACPPDTAALTTAKATFSRENGWPRYTLAVEGRGLTFPFGETVAMEVSMAVTLHDTEAEALKEVLAVESGHMSANDTSVFAELFAEEGSTELETVVVPGLGTRAARAHLRLRGMMRVDVDYVVFSRGRLSAGVMVTRPAGGRDSVDVDSVAREMDRRIQGLLRDTSAAAAPRTLVDAVRRVVDAENAVDSLIGAREFDAAFRVIDRLRRSKAPVGLSASTWNTVCWWASLYGHARRALAACEAAVARDTTVAGHRDSRGLARALTGNLKGASDDFAFVVEHGDAGEFVDERAAWLDALRAGRNPFTEEVLSGLRGGSPP